MPESRTELFFRPDSLACERLTIPAALYNRCRLALSRCPNEHVFVPIRSMQIMAVIDLDEIIFVDNHDYAVQDGQGGKLICLAWVFRPETGRSDLTEPAPIEMLYFREDARELHSRLVGELMQALEQMEGRLRAGDCERRSRKVLPFRR